MSAITYVLVAGLVLGTQNKYGSASSADSLTLWTPFQIHTRTIGHARLIRARLEHHRDLHSLLHLLHLQYSIETTNTGSDCLLWLQVRGHDCCTGMLSRDTFVARLSLCYHLHQSVLILLSGTLPGFSGDSSADISFDDLDQMPSFANTA